MREPLLALHRPYIPSTRGNVVHRPYVRTRLLVPNLQSTRPTYCRQSARPLVPYKSSMSQTRSFSTQSADWGPVSTNGTLKAPVPARPSSSVLLISPQNEVLLLHRVSHSSSFAAAHVFPGGHLDAYHGETLPTPPDTRRHEDSEAYRLAAVRETFEESGILLVHPLSTSAPSADSHDPLQLLQLSDDERDEGRKLVHNHKVLFTEWLNSKGGMADTSGLIPFTHWVTPPNLPKRFTTQMYVYFLPLAHDTHVPSSTSTSLSSSARESVIPTPTHDGGIEHTAARFAAASEWLELARREKIILFPPQFLLLHLIEQFLSPPARSREEIERQRESLRRFLHSGDPPWTEKCISPIQLMKRKSDGRAVLSLEKPGYELEGTQRRGDGERVVLVEFRKEGPRRVEVAWRRDVLDEERNGSRSSEKL